MRIHIICHVHQGNCVFTFCKKFLKRLKSLIEKTEKMTIKKNLILSIHERIENKLILVNHSS